MVTRFHCFRPHAGETKHHDRESEMEPGTLPQGGQGAERAMMRVLIRLHIPVSIISQ